MVDLTALVLSFAQAPIINALLNGIVGFLTDQVRDLGGKELTDRVAALRSDARFRQQIQEATERAARRWAESYPDRELVRAVAEDTRFADLPLVQQAIRQFARNPFSPVADETLRGKFGEVLPDRFEPERVERGVAELLEDSQRRARDHPRPAGDAPYRRQPRGPPTTPPSCRVWKNC